MPLVGADYDFSEDFNKLALVKTNHPIQPEVFIENVFFYGQKLISPFDQGSTPCEAATKSCQHQVVTFLQFAFPLPQA